VRTLREWRGLWNLPRLTSNIRFTRYVSNPLQLPGFEIESAFRISARESSA